MTPDPAVLRDEIARFVTRHGTPEALDLILFDALGGDFGKQAPFAKIHRIAEAGIGISSGQLLHDPVGNGFGIQGISVEDGDPDFPCTLIPGSLHPVPWARRPTAQCLLQMHAMDRAAPVFWQPRNVLAKVVAGMAAQGLHPRIACELEFYLAEKATGASGLREMAKGQSGLPPRGPRSMWFRRLEQNAPFLDAVEAACTAQGLVVEGRNAEYGPAQFECNVRYVDDALLAADQALMFKRIVRGVADGFGLDATFMAKPFAAFAGSGLHVHVSLLDDDGRNVLGEGYPGSDARLLSAIAGLQAAHSEAMAVFVPSFSSFRRFSPGNNVPLNCTWGPNNRSVAFRIPPDGGEARRIEHRVAGADANPYLAIAAILGAMQHGIEARLTPTPPMTGNADHLIGATESTRIWQTLARFRASDLMGRIFGPFRDVYAELKELELEGFLADCREREHEWYF